MRPPVVASSAAVFSIRSRPAAGRSWTDILPNTSSSPSCAASAGDPFDAHAGVVEGDLDFGARPEAGPVADRGRNHHAACLVDGRLHAITIPFAMPRLFLAFALTYGLLRSSEIARPVSKQV